MTIPFPRMCATPTPPMPPGLRQPDRAFRIAATLYEVARQEHEVWLKAPHRRHRHLTNAQATGVAAVPPWTSVTRDEFDAAYRRVMRGTSRPNLFDAVVREAAKRAGSQAI